MSLEKTVKRNVEKAWGGGWYLNRTNMRKRKDLQTLLKH